MVTAFARRLFLVPCVGLFTAISSMTVMADEPNVSRGQEEMRKAVESLRPHPSIDTTPVDFSVGDVHYRMPRNYLFTMENWNGGPQGLVTVRVNIPDLKPLDETTRDCFTKPGSFSTSICDPLSFTINVTGTVTAEQGFENSRPIYRNQSPLDGPFGYERYEIGPDNARIEFYRKVENGRTLIYHCQIFQRLGKRDGICDPSGDRVSNGSEIHFFFSLRHLADIAEIDRDLRTLTEHFTVTPVDNK